MATSPVSSLEALLRGDEFDGDVRFDEPLSRHTTYHIGGPARYFVTANSIEALEAVVRSCEAEGVPWEVAGKGSNLLVADEGFPGAIITLGRDFRSMRFGEESNLLVAGAGVVLATVVREARDRGLSGLEFAVGTPGTIGGALRMNAGTRTQWIGGIVASVTTLRRGVGIVRTDGSALEWGYRTSPFASDEIVLDCELRLTPMDPAVIRGKMEVLLQRRHETQPFSQPSCGSVFRNPEGFSVGEMIEQVGMKGVRCGGAQVSEVHANFIVNTGDATANDVRTLIDSIKTKVSQAYGIELQPEVKFLGFA